MPNLTRRNFIGLLSGLPFIGTLNAIKLGQSSQFKVICQKWVRNERGHAKYAGYTLHLTERDRVDSIELQYASNDAEAFDNISPTPGFVSADPEGEPYECMVDRKRYNSLIAQTKNKVWEPSIIYGPPPLAA